MRAIVITVIAVAGCSAGNDSVEPEDFAEAVRNPQGVQAEPLPPLEQPETFGYRVRGHRSPFESSAGWAAVHRAKPALAAPDSDRSRHLLRSVPVDRIAMVGTLARGNVRFGLVRVDGGRVHRIGVGDYLGEQRGRVQAIDPLAMELLEIVHNGGARAERTRIVSLRRPLPEFTEDRKL
ncbi:MAG: pilus assembly protein PilP [Gammaproteobacteria bacterium]|nr:pilus assembly protein PilP [Gammaproteobacteria bacterium]